MAKRVSRFQLWVSLVISLASICAAVFNSVDNILIDCGSEQSTNVDQRTFLPDNQVSSWTLSAPNSLLATDSSSSASSGNFAVLHKTARIFPSPSSYTFPIKTRGRHFIRFHFYPFLFQGYELTTACFSISAQGISLRKAFRPRIVPPDMLREYSMNITTGPLVISFTPSMNSFAFVNGIEVISVPDSLILNRASTVNSQGPYYDYLPATVLETIHRVNMGGPLVTPFNDTLGRTWVTDDIFLTNQGATNTTSFSGNLNFLEAGATEETAPTFVYSTARESVPVEVLNYSLNITWQFDVDVGFSYLVRMHFCDIVSPDSNKLYFNIYIGGMTAAESFDLSKLTSRHLAAPYYSDFVVGVGEDGKTKLSVSINPSNVPHTPYRKAILNGLEIMKMNNSLGNLDGPIPSTSSPQDRKINLGIVLGPALVMAVLAIILLVLLYRYKITTSNTRQPYLGVMKYSFDMLREATENFNDHNEIGRGGFGIVYKGVLDNVEVAIKRAFQHHVNLSLDRQFHTELQLMTELLHVHLVSLLGFCDERDEKILVYEFMHDGNLQQHLYGSDEHRNHQILSWEQRLEICIGAARGLHYIHTSKQPPIVHRDVKTTNILLDEKLLAKIADFGISKKRPPVDSSSVGQVSTVKGSDGYVDPEYQITGRLTDKSDVYSFGVVLWEVLCAIPVLNKDPLPVPQEQSHQGSEVKYIVEWALIWYNKNDLDVIVDPNIKGTIMPDSLTVFAEIATMCVRDKGDDRPSIGTVLSNLEKALRLQQGKTQENDLDILAEKARRVQDSSSNSDSSYPAELANTSTTKSGSLSSVSCEFSMLMGAKGR